MAFSGIELNDEIAVERLHSAFRYDFPNDFSYDGESHAAWEFVYIAKGKASITADNMTYILKSGEMVCHKPYEHHAIKPYQGRAVAIILCFECKSEQMQHFNNKIMSVPQAQRNMLNDIAARAEHIFEPKEPLDISKDYGMNRASYSSKLVEQYIKNAIELLIISLLETTSTEMQKRRDDFEQAKQRRTLTKDIKAYLNESYGEQIRLNELSTRFSYSPSSIKRIFKAETGYSVIDYLNSLRIERAKELLVETDLSTESIAHALGIANGYYFSRMFSARVGISPRAYKKDKKQR